MWSLPVSRRTRVWWQLLAGSSKGSSFSCSRPAVLLQRVEKGSDGGPGVRPGAQGNNWESLEQLNRGDREFCSLAPAPPSRDGPSSAAAWAPGREQPAGRVGMPSCGSCRALRRPLSPRLRAAVPGEWARGGTSLGAPPPACPDPTRRARARALCIKPSSSAKVEEVGLPPGWEAGGNSAPVVFRQREWVAGAGGGVRPPTTGWALGRDSGAWSPAQLLAPDIGLTPSILPGGCGKWSYSAVPRTWEEYWVPLGSAHPAKPELEFPEGPLSASGARWPQASGRPSPGFSSASERCWPAGSPQVRGDDLEAKSWCEATVGRGEPGTEFPPTPWIQSWPRPRSRPGRVLTFLLAAQLFAGRNFTEPLIKGKTSLPSLEWAAGEAAKGLRRWKLGKLKMETLKRCEMFIFVLFF